nr:hypothetical protein CFP56_27735 [Quercus suber]
MASGRAPRIGRTRPATIPGPRISNKSSHPSVNDLAAKNMRSAEADGALGAALDAVAGAASGATPEAGEAALDEAVGVAVEDAAGKGALDDVAPGVTSGAGAKIEWERLGDVQEELPEKFDEVEGEDDVEGEEWNGGDVEVMTEAA